ncbi:MAG: hypothetical protein LAO09_22220 [Acidobacteriia bacterium]|nr:hypothetical protein [Terriglobia bacterium]
MVDETTHDEAKGDIAERRAKASMSERGKQGGRGNKKNSEDENVPQVSQDRTRAKVSKEQGVSEHALKKEAEARQKAALKRGTQSPLPSDDGDGKPKGRAAAIAAQGTLSYLTSRVLQAIQPLQKLHCVPMRPRYPATFARRPLVPDAYRGVPYAPSLCALPESRFSGQLKGFA